MMVFSLGPGGPEEADPTMRIKGIPGSTQAPFRQAGFLRALGLRYAEQGEGSDPYIQVLFWRPTPLLEQMRVVRSLPSFSLGLWHTHNSKMKAKETRRSIHSPLDDRADMLLEKPDPDNDLLRTEEDFLSIVVHWASVILTARIRKTIRGEV